jgi:hypothetical protein
MKWMVARDSMCIIEETGSTISREQYLKLKTIRSNRQEVFAADNKPASSIFYSACSVSSDINYLLQGITGSANRNSHFY